MLKSRRGLLAAGLAVAVVGAFGVASTLNAGADELHAPDAKAPPAVAAAAENDSLAPPSVLPWGERPKKIKRGRGGDSSRSLRAEGLSAAPADASGSTRPRGRYGPKGRSNRTSFLKTEHTNLAPNAPAPAPSSATPPPDNGGADVNYLYGVGSQTAETDGVFANLTVSKPTLAKADYHTLAEMAVQSADGQQIVEVGWNVDRVVNGDDDPHLFVFHWVNGQPTCYNACGFVGYSKNVTAGATLTYDVAKKFGIQYFNGAWWIAYDTEWIGFFPETLWNQEGAKFSRSGIVQVFGEVASTTTKPCSEMGNGQTPDKTTATKAASISFLNGPAEQLNVRATSDFYNVTALSGRTFRFGGPGAC